MHLVPSSLLPCHMFSRYSHAMFNYFTTSSIYFAVSGHVKRIEFSLRESGCCIN
jgi:hypothetical protein